MKGLSVKTTLVDGAIYHPAHPEVIRNWYWTRSTAAKRGWKRRRARAAAVARWSKNTDDVARAVTFRSHDDAQRYLRTHRHLRASLQPVQIISRGESDQSSPARGVSQ